MIKTNIDILLDNFSMVEGCKDSDIVKRLTKILLPVRPFFGNGL